LSTAVAQSDSRLIQWPIVYICVMRLTYPLEIGTRFCVSRKGETGGGGWVYPKGANSMAVSLERPWLAPRGQFLSFLA